MEHKVRYVYMNALINAMEQQLTKSSIIPALGIKSKESISDPTTFQYGQNARAFWAMHTSKSYDMCAVCRRLVGGLVTITTTSPIKISFPIVWIRCDREDKAYHKISEV